MDIFGPFGYRTWPVTECLLYMEIELEQLYIRRLRKKNLLTPWGYFAARIKANEKCFSNFANKITISLFKLPNIYGIFPLDCYGIWCMSRPGPGLAPHLLGIPWYEFITNVSRYCCDFDLYEWHWFKLILVACGITIMLSQVFQDGK